MRLVVHQWGRNKHMGRRQFIGVGSPVEEGQGHVGGCVLVAARKINLAELDAMVRRHQPSTTVAGKEVAPAH